MLHYLLDLLSWLIERLHKLMCAVGHHQWSFTYAQSWEDDYLWHQCVLCKKEVRLGLQGGVTRET